MEEVGCPLCGSTRRQPVVVVKERLLGTGEAFTLAQCDGCGLLRADTRPTKAEMFRYYPEYYGPYQAESPPAAQWLRPGLKGMVRPWTLTAHYGYRLTSLRGLVGAEALACGTPVVGSDAGAIPEVVCDCGFLFPRGDVRTLRERIREAVKDPTRLRELGQQGRARIEARFSHVQVLGTMTEIFESVIARPVR